MVTRGNLVAFSIYLLIGDGALLSHIARACAQYQIAIFVKNGFSNTSEHDSDSP